MIQAAVLATLTLSGVVQVWEIICLALSMGLINSFDIPSRQSMTLDMVGRDDLRHAISLNSMMFNAARIVGPTIAGGLIALVGEGICFAVNAISFGAVLISLLMMKLAERPPRVNRNALREVADGYRYLHRLAADPHFTSACGRLVHVRSGLCDDDAGGGARPDPR